MTDTLDILTSIADFTAAAGAGKASNRPAKLATIDPQYASGAPRVTFDGELTMSTKRYPCLGTYMPTANTRVLLMPVGTTYMIIGSVCT